MGCMLLLLLGVLWSVVSNGRGCHRDNGVAKGAGTTHGKGEGSVHAMSLVRACLVVVVYV